MSDTKKTLGDADLGYLDVSDGDLEDGHFDAAPVGNYEGKLDPTIAYEWDENGDMERVEGGTLHAGMIEPDGFRRKHGDIGEFGFVRRPLHKTDVERN